MENKHDENYFIYFLRFAFSVAILFYHSWIFNGDWGNGFFNYGYLAVDFYFILNGFFMMNSIYKHKDNKENIINQTIKYVLDKFKKLFPSLLITFIIGIFFVYGKNAFDIRFILSKNLLPELFQLGILGYDMNINSSWWYTSSMFIVLLILYPLAKKYKDTYINYICPLIILFTMGLVISMKININDPVTLSFYLRNGFYKAIIFIALGNLIYLVVNKVKNIELTKTKVYILSIIEFLLYVFIFLNMNYNYVNNFTAAILLSISLVITLSNKTIHKYIFKHNFWKKLGTYGFYLFLCNISIRTFFLRKYMNQGLSYKTLFINFVLLSMLLALIIYILIEIVYKKLIKKKINS